MQVSILEIYNETIRDLLAQDVGDRKLEVRQDAVKGMYVPDLTLVPVVSMAEVLELLDVADQNRSVASTNMNQHSSRSHLMLSCDIESKNKVDRTARLARQAPPHRPRGLGAHRQVGRDRRAPQGGAEHQQVALRARRRDSRARNKQGHVPVPQLDAPHMLQDSLEKDSKTLMFRGARARRARASRDARARARPFPPPPSPLPRRAGLCARPR